jgi:YfiH family protein
MLMPDSLQTGWISCPHTPPGVRAIVTTRHGGQSGSPYAANNLALHVGDETQHVLDNRGALQAQLGASQVQWLQQVHGVACVQAELHANGEPEADAIWTREQSLAVGILTADCVPVLVWDTTGTVVGAAHAGWRGLVDGVLEGLIERMPAPAARLCAWIGPCIGVAHYEVGRDVWQHFSEQADVVLRPHGADDNKRYLNLAGAAQMRLHAAGVPLVHQSGLCTFTDRRFYSYRRAGGQHTGRFASVIMRQ